MWRLGHAIIREIVVHRIRRKDRRQYLYRRRVQTQQDFTYGGDGGLATAANYALPRWRSFDKPTETCLSPAAANKRHPRVAAGTTSDRKVKLDPPSREHIYLYTGGFRLVAIPRLLPSAQTATPTVGLL